MPVIPCGLAKSQSKETSLSTQPTKPLAILNRKEFERSLVGGKVVYVLLARMLSDVSKEICELPGDVRQIIHEFGDVKPDELPDGLPPLRDIKHAIDLVPGSPNLSHYRMIPTEQEEMKRQVGELLRKGFIQECLSPSDVRTVEPSKRLPVSIGFLFLDFFTC